MSLRLDPSLLSLGNNTDNNNNNNNILFLLLCASTALIIHGANKDHQQNIAQ